MAFKNIGRFTNKLVEQLEKKGVPKLGTIIPELGMFEKGREALMEGSFRKGEEAPSPIAGNWTPANANSKVIGNVRRRNC